MIDDDLDPFDHVEAYYLIEEQADNRRLTRERDQARAELEQVRSELRDLIRYIKDHPGSYDEDTLIHDLRVVLRPRATIAPEDA